MDRFSLVPQKIKYTRMHHKPNLRVFTYADLEKATMNFDPSLEIGDGQYGKIYKGWIKDQDHGREKICVAIKDLSQGLHGKEQREWEVEVKDSRDIEHKNLVKLLGYCVSKEKDSPKRFLVYEYMRNGSIQDHLMNSYPRPLLWPTRLKIAQDAARGLAFLHENEIVMRCFKSSVVLLDDNFNAKLADSIFAKLGPFPYPTVEAKEQYGCHVGDFACYASPEFSNNGKLTSANDVFGYGVFLFELITGRKASEPGRCSEEKMLVPWVEKHFSDMSKFKLILDPKLKGKYSLDSAHELAAVAKMCTARKRQERPSMCKVLEMINEIVEAS